MNLFLPYPTDLSATARFLDDGRLNKQVVEAYQVGRVVLRRMLEPDAKIGWKNHPSSLLIYNEGRPKFPWLQTYIETLDEEWRFRGFNRSADFTSKIEALFVEADGLRELHSDEPVCAFLGNGELVQGDSALIGKLYREYLNNKFESQVRPPRWTGRDRPVV